MNSPEVLKHNRAAIRRYSKSEQLRAEMQDEAEKKKQADIRTADLASEMTRKGAYDLITEARSVNTTAQAVLTGAGLEVRAGVGRGISTDEVHAGSELDKLGLSVQIAKSQASIVGAVKRLLRYREQVEAARQRRIRRARNIRFFSIVSGLFLVIIGILAYRPVLLGWHMTQANAALKTGDWNAAVNEARAVMELEPGNSAAPLIMRESFYQLASESLENEKWEQVRMHLEEMWQTFPRYPEAGGYPAYKDSSNLLRESFYSPGETAFIAEDWEESRIHLEALAQIDVNYRDTTMMLTITYYNLATEAVAAQVWDAALPVLEALESLSPDYQDAQTMLIETYYSLARMAGEDQLWESAAMRILQLDHYDLNHADVLSWIVDTPELNLALSGIMGEKWLNGSFIELENLDLGYIVQAAAFNPMRWLLATGSGNGEIKYYDLGSDNSTETLTDHDSTISFLVFSSDSRFLASYSWDRRVSIWDVSSGQLVADFPGQSSAVNGISLSPDGMLIAVSQSNGNVKIWDVISGREAGVLSVRTAGIYNMPSSIHGVAFSPEHDQHLLAAALGDGRVVLWDIAADSLVHTFPNKGSSKPNILEFSPDGRLLAVVYPYGLIDIWEVSSGRVLQSFDRTPTLINNTAFSPDGKVLITGSQNNLT